MFDLRARYAFDSSEGQIPEGSVSVYGPANSHANCVPASFTAALNLAGFGDIDPQRITNEVYGPNFRGGFGTFTSAIAWIKANVPNSPSFSDGPFDFAVAEAAGQAGQLIVIAGWIDAPSVTFVAERMAAGFSHASLLVAHLADEKYVIWNTWTGQLQTYDRAVLAASLYEMSIAGGTYGPGKGTAGGFLMSLTDQQQSDLLAYAKQSTDHLNTFFGLFEEGPDGPDWNKPDGTPGPWKARLQAKFAELLTKPARVTVDETVVLAAIDDLKKHPPVASDPVTLGKIDALSKHLGLGSA